MRGTYYFGVSPHRFFALYFDIFYHTADRTSQRKFKPNVWYDPSEDNEIGESLDGYGPGNPDNEICHARPD